MSAVSFTLLEAEGEGDNKAMRSYKTKWQAMSNNASDHALTILSSPLMPSRPNSPYAIGNDLDLLAYATKARARRPHGATSRLLWHVWIDYTTKPARESNENEEGEFNNPLLKPLKFSGEFDDRRIRITKDLDAVEIRNSAGDDLPLENEAPIFRMQMTKNMPTFDVPLWKQYAKKAANSDQFWGAPPGTVLCAGIRPEIEFWQGGIPFYPTTFDLLFIDPTDDMPNWHEVELRDEGPRYWTGGTKGTGAKVHFRDDTGVQFADGTGDLNGTGGKAGPNDDIFYQTFKVKNKLPFGALGLPTTNPYT